MIDITWESPLPADYDIGAISKFCEMIAVTCGVREDENVSIVFVSNEEICELNTSYRNKSEPTDILSFAFKEVEPWPSGDSDSLLGEMFISVEMIATNAQYFHVDEMEELKRVIIHGFLHLLGYDHETNEEHEVMLYKQEKILEQLTNFSLKKL